MPPRFFEGFHVVTIFETESGVKTADGLGLCWRRSRESTGLRPPFSYG